MEINLFEQPKIDLEDLGSGFLRQSEFRKAKEYIRKQIELYKSVIDQGVLPNYALKIEEDVLKFLEQPSFPKKDAANLISEFYIRT